MPYLKALLWRIVIVIVVAIILAYIVPLFLAFVGFTVSALALQLLRACLVCIAIIYVFWGPEPKALF